jgi:hypothetical protein
MHIAIELLLKRMESNPDEFVKGHNRHVKWERIIEKYMEFVNPEDKKILKEKYSTLQLDQMHKEVMAELLYGDERDAQPPIYKDPKQMELMLEFEKFKYQQLTEQGLFNHESTA